MSWIYQPFLSGAGQGAALNFAADPEQYSITFQEARITYNRRIMASNGAFSLSATSPMVKVARILSAGAGSMVVSGYETGFSHIPVVVMEGGAVACQFQPGTIIVKRRLTAEHRLVRVIGQAAMQADASCSRQSADIGLSVGL